ncbi:MAG: PKD domain-containing protein [Methanoregula sp.]|nr:PKD domain-containing protein [Methanoregula sp.]
MGKKNHNDIFRLVVFCLAFFLLVAPAMAATTNLTITKYANDGTTILNQTTKDYTWLEANLPVQGDGVTHYFHQGPTFNDSDPYDPGEYQNVLTRDWGAVKGTDVRDLAGLVGGAHTGDTIKFRAADGMTLTYPYEYVYTPDPRQGPMVIAWYCGEDNLDGYELQGVGYPPDYRMGMRLIMFADTSTNPWGYHVFGDNDMLQVWAPQYRYNYSGTWPSSGGISEKYVRNISIMSQDPVPVVPTAAFTTDVQTGTAPLTVHFTDGSTGTTPLTYAWDFTNDGSVDSTVQNPSYTYTTAGTYTVKLTVTNIAGSDSELKTNYITAGTQISPPVAGFFTDVTSGPAPLSIKFTDTSTGTGITAWMWDFNNDWVIDSTAQNPSFVYTVPGTYSVNLTVTNSAGSDNEVKVNYITVNTAPVVPVTNITQIGVFRPATRYWYFDDNLDGKVEKSFRYGIAADQIMVGDWDGDGKDGIAVFRPATRYWYFDDNLDGKVEKSFRYGIAADQIMVGDWDGDGKDGIAVFRPATRYWYFDDNLDGKVDKSFRYGIAADQIINGKWV